MRPGDRARDGRAGHRRTGSDDPGQHDATGDANAGRDRDAERHRDDVDIAGSFGDPARNGRSRTQRVSGGDAGAWLLR